MSRRFLILAQAAAMVTVLAACDTAPTAKSTEAPPPVAQPTVEPEPAPQPTSRAEKMEAEPVAVTSAAENLTEVERRFAEGLNQYNDGNYPQAIRIFREPIFARSWPELQSRALKYLAFSYCVNNNVQQCRTTFVQLLKLNPEFELSSAESSHPVWGAAFKQAKADVAKSAK